MAFRFEHLEIWKEAIAFANAIYHLTKRFPREELFALTSQLRRAVSSISTTIAEGSGSSSKKDFSHYLDIAIKSTFEVVSLLQLAMEQGYITEDEKSKFYKTAEILVKKINSLKKSLTTINYKQ